ncbi:MAG: enoyl-CoA hydratase/isomerase family protein [Jatrophihabitantaceae bacterium]
MTLANRLEEAGGSPLAKRVSVELRGQAAFVWLGAGLRRNALRGEDWIELERLLGTLAERSEVKAVVVRGVQGTFSSGSDLTEWATAESRYVDRTFGAMESALSSLERMDAVTIAAVEGVATGAGCEIALACDLRVMARSARIGMPVVRHAIRVSPMFAFRLSDVVGVPRARDLLLTGRLIGAEVADQWGLASRITDDDAFDECVTQLLDCVTAQPRGALVTAKRSTSRPLEHARAHLHDSDWRYVDEREFPERIMDFLTRSGRQ